VEESAGRAFISYVREDSERVDKLQRDLQAAGIPVWRDIADLWPGQDWRTMIRRAITDNALVFLACFSSQSVSKRKSYQNEELTLAREQLRLRQPDDPLWLIPVRFDDCQVPDLDIGAGRTLGSIQRADLFGDRYEEGMKRLVTIVQRLLGQQSEEQHMADARQADVLRLQAEEQRARESAERQRAEAGKAFV
jgi:TIR domain-containing protein